MILIKPSFTIETPDFVFDGMLERIERAGRTCYKSEAKIAKDTAESFVAAIIDRGHTSVIEHESISVRIICDRGVSHELVRHRLAAFSQESTRYCDYTKGQVCFVIPPWCQTLCAGPAGSETDDAARRTLDECANNEMLWLFAMQQAENNYRQLRKRGWLPQQARAVLPNSLKTEIVITANLRVWRHIFQLRTSKQAHPQMREIMEPLALALQKKVPVVFDGWCETCD
jgi:thymidylate synthase (FAD)